MCFIKTSSAQISQSSYKEDTVERHQADANLTKNSNREQTQKGYSKNYKTGPVGLEDSANVDKKTLLGE